MRFMTAVIASALLLSGCGNKIALQSRAGLTVLPTNVLPAPVADSQQSERVFHIGVSDKLKIDVFGIDELSREVQVDASGRINLPLAGSLVAAGSTPEELGKVIEQQLRGQYVRNPRVAVIVSEVQSQTVTIDGEVREPGIYPVVGRMTLVRAIAAAKGTTEFTKLDDVVVFRTVNRQRMAALYNLGAIRRGLYDDPDVYASDVIVVGNSSSSRLIKTLTGIAPSLVTPLILLFQ
jgi:polysaccharide biosynthesis/export protein